MTPVTQTLTLDRAALTDAQDTLYEEVSDPAVARAAHHLIVRHRLGQRFEIEALDVPHAALAGISEQLEEAGLSHALADPLIDALRRYIMNNGGAFSRAANAKPARIHMVVADRMPKSRFDNAMTELACLGPREVKVEGATRVNVRATPSGTATSSNAADVDAMFAQVRGLFLWVRFEAPTKEDLDGLMNSIEATLAGVAQSVGGAMGAGDFKKLLEILQKDGAITLAVTALVGKLIQIQQAMSKDGKIALPPAELGALLKDIGALMDKGQGLVPPALAEAVMRSMAEMTAANPAVAEFLTERGFSPLLADNDNISVEERLDAVMEKVAALAALDGLDPALAAELAEILQKAQADLKAGEVTPAALLDAMNEKLTAIAARGDIPQVVMDGIGAVLPEIAALRENPQVTGAPPEHAQGEALLAMLEEIAAKIEKGEVDIDALPPEMKALIEKMGGVEVLMQKEGREARAEALAEAIAANQATELSAAVQAAVAAMIQPDAISALPAPVQSIVENFVTQNPVIIERAAPHMAAPMADTTSRIDAAAAVPTDMVVKPDVVPPSNNNVTPLAAVTAVTTAALAQPLSPPSMDMPPVTSASPPQPVDGAPPAPPVADAASPAPPPAPLPQQPPAPPKPVDVAPVVPPTVKTDPVKPEIITLIKKMDAFVANPDKSNPAQAQAIIAKLVKQDLVDMSKGKIPTADQVEFTLKKIDTILAKEADPVKRQEIIEARNQYNKVTKEVPGVDPNLRNEPSGGICKPPCPCPTNDFPKGQPGEKVTPEQINQVRQHFDNLKRDNPNGPDVQVADNGQVTVTTKKPDGTLHVATTTIEKIQESIAVNEAVKESFKKNKLYEQTTGVAELEELAGSGLKPGFKHVCGDGCDHGVKEMTKIEPTVEARKVNRAALRAAAPGSL